MNIKKLIPRQAKPIGKKIMRLPKRLKAYGNYLTKKIVTKEMFLKGLEELGIKKGDAVEVHSSLSSFGFVEGGAKTVIESILEQVGEEGTVLMPTFHGFNLHDIQPFDAEKSKSVVGTITECFRKFDGVERSLHPTHSVAVCGKHAKYLIKDTLESKTPFDEHSPFYKLLSLDAKIVCLGVDIDTISFYHAVEDSMKEFPLPIYLPKAYSVKSIDNQGKTREIETKAHDPEFHNYCIDKNPAIIKRIKNHFREEGIISETFIGRGYCCSLPVNGVFRCLRSLAEKGETIYAISKEEQEQKKAG
ncbi:MAG: AAC(3) family N-acetyltransferase [archaeon]